MSKFSSPVRHKCKLPLQAVKHSGPSPRRLKQSYAASAVAPPLSPSSTTLPPCVRTDSPTDGTFLYRINIFPRHFFLINPSWLGQFLEQELVHGDENRVFSSMMDMHVQTLADAAARDSRHDEYDTLMSMRFMYQCMVPIRTDIDEKGVTIATYEAQFKGVRTRGKKRPSLDLIEDDDDDGEADQEVEEVKDEIEEDDDIQPWQNAPSPNKKQRADAPLPPVLATPEKRSDTPPTQSLASLPIPADSDDSLLAQLL